MNDEKVSETHLSFNAEFEARCKAGDYEWVLKNAKKPVGMSDEEYAKASKLSVISCQFTSLLSEAEKTEYGGSITSLGSALVRVLGKDVVVFIAALTEFALQVVESTMPKPETLN